MEEGVRAYDVRLTPNTEVMCPISKAIDAEMRVNGVKVSTVRGESNSVECIATVGDTEQSLIYVFDTGCGTHWNKIIVCLKFGPVPPLGAYSIHPEDMKDEDVEEVVFEDFTINIAEEGNEGDILLSRRRR